MTDPIQTHTAPPAGDSIGLEGKPRETGPLKGAGNGWLYRVVVLVLALTVLLLSPLLVPLFNHWQAARAYPYQLDAEEGFVLNQALTLARGGSIYTPITRPPFVVGNYTPLFPWVYSWFVGRQATPESLPLGRALVQLAALGAALMLGGIVGARTRRLLPALLAPLLFLSAYEVFHWGAFVRVDLPALFLTVAGLGAFLLIRPRWGMAVAAILFVLAAYTRQTAIVTPVACALALVLNDRRRLAWFLIPFAGLGLLIFAWLQWRTGGEFYRHVVVYNQNRLDWNGWRLLLRNEIWFWHHWLIGAVGVLAVLLVLGRLFEWIANQRGTWNRVDDEHEHEHEIQSVISSVALGRSDLRSQAVAIYGVLGALSLLSYAKIGAAPNYALEPLLAAVLWGMDALGRMMGEMRNVECGMRNFSRSLLPGATFSLPNEDSNIENSPGKARRWVMNLGVPLVALCLAAHAGSLGLKSFQFAWSPTPTVYDRAAAREVWLAARAAPGDIFCEEPIFTLLAGKPVLEQPFIMTQLAREGKWNYEAFARLLRQRRFSLVVVTEDLASGAVRGDYERYSAGMVRALREAYTPSSQVRFPTLGKSCWLWRPRP